MKLGAFLLLAAQNSLTFTGPLSAGSSVCNDRGSKQSNQNAGR
jgi:hypothetical protein